MEQGGEDRRQLLLESEQRQLSPGQSAWGSTFQHPPTPGTIWAHVTAGRRRGAAAAALLV